MAFEKRWAAIPPTSFTADGGTKASGYPGLVTIPSTLGYHEKQQVVINATGFPSVTDIEVKAVISSTQMYVGPKGNIGARSDLTGYTVANGALIFANTQDRPSIPLNDVNRAVFEEAPASAFRMMGVDQLGDPYGPGNPMPVTSDNDGILLFNLPYDSGQTTYPSSTQTVYTTYVGGFSGTPVQQVTLNFTDATQNNLLNWQRANWNGSEWIVSL